RKDDSSRGQEAIDRVAVAKERVQRVREGHHRRLYPDTPTAAKTPTSTKTRVNGRPSESGGPSDGIASDASAPTPTAVKTPSRAKPGLTAARVNRAASQTASQAMPRQYALQELQSALQELVRAADTGPPLNTLLACTPS